MTNIKLIMDEIRRLDDEGATLTEEEKEAAVHKIGNAALDAIADRVWDRFEQNRIAASKVAK